MLPWLESHHIPVETEGFEHLDDLKDALREASDSKGRVELNKKVGAFPQDKGRAQIWQACVKKYIANDAEEIAVFPPGPSKGKGANNA